MRFFTPTPPLSTCLRGNDGVVLQLNAILRGKSVITERISLLINITHQFYYSTDVLDLSSR